MEKQLAGLGVQLVDGTPEASGAFLKQKVAEMKVGTGAANLKPQ